MGFMVQWRFQCLFQSDNGNYGFAGSRDFVTKRRRQGDIDHKNPNTEVGWKLIFKAPQ